MGNNCQSDSTKLERIIRGSENTMSDLYALISASISKYFEVLANCCIGKNNNLKSAIILIDDYTNFNDQAGDVINEVIDDIIDKILEDTPGVAIQYGAAYFNGVCIKELTPNLETVIEVSFQSHICVLFEEPLPDFTYEATYTDFVCSYDQGELFPYAYEALFMGHQCVLRDGNYFYPEYSASFIDFVCEFEPACDTFSTVLCTSSELCELSMTSEWLDYSCFIAELDFDISFADHSCIKNMTYDVSYQGHVCILGLQEFLASFIDFVCILISDVTTTTTQVKSCGYGVSNSAVYQEVITTTTTGVGIECNGTVTFEGGQNYPTHNVHNIGTSTGIMTLYFGVGDIPDRIIIYIGGVVVFDAGYIGEKAKFDFGGTRRSEFKNALMGKTDPITGHVYPNFSDYPSDGYPRISIEQLFQNLTFFGPNFGFDYRCFNKTTSDTVADVYVYGPMPGTGWAYLLSCPDTECASLVSTTTTTSIV